MASRRSLHSAPRPAAITPCYPTPAHFPCPQVILADLVCPHTSMLLQSMSFIQCIPRYITHLPFRLPFIRSLFMLPGRLLSHKRILTASSHHRAQVSSFIRSSFQQECTFTSCSFSRLHFRSLHFARHSFIHSMHFAAPRQHIKSIPLRFGCHLPSHKFPAAFQTPATAKSYTHGVCEVSRSHHATAIHPHFVP